MKNILLSCLLSVFLVQGVQAKPATKPTEYPLAAYLLTPQQLQKMGPEQTKKYFLLLSELLAALESAQGAKRYEDHVAFWRYDNLLKEFLVGAAADAAEAGGQTEESPERRSPRQRRIYAPGGQGAVLRLDDKEGAVRDPRRAEAIRARRAEEQAAREKAAAEAASASAGAAPAAGAPAAAPTPPVAKIENPCLYGAHVSQYAKVDGKTVCKRPEGKLDSETCKGPTGKPKFQCNTFGVENSNLRGKEKIFEKTCIDFYGPKGLNDLSERCMFAFRTWLTNAAPVPKSDWNILRDDNYAQFFQGLAAHFKAYEKDNIAGQTLAAYCANDNQVNQRKQKAECTAVSKFIGEMVAFAEEQVSENNQKLSNNTSAPASGRTAPAAQ